MPEALSLQEKTDLALADIVTCSRSHFAPGWDSAERTNRVLISGHRISAALADEIPMHRGGAYDDCPCRPIVVSESRDSRNPDDGTEELIWLGWLAIHRSLEPVAEPSVCLPDRRQVAVERAIRTFEFRDYGLVGVDPKDSGAKWVAPLAAAVVAVIEGADCD